MLKPAILYKEELEKKFAELLYTQDYFYYNGYAHCNDLPTIKTEDCYYQYAILDGDKLVGYLTYYVNMWSDSVERFGLISFEKGNLTVSADVFSKIKEMVRRYRRVEWRCIEGNPVNKVYRKLIERYNGYISTAHKCCVDNDGNYLDNYIYEILKERIDSNDK
jgi:hypothetical protein